MYADTALWLRFTPGLLIMVASGIILVASLVALIKILRHHAWGEPLEHTDGLKDQSPNPQHVEYEEPTEFYGQSGFEDSYFIDAKPETKDLAPIVSPGLSGDTTPIIIQHWDKDLKLVAQNETADNFFNRKLGNTADKKIGTEFFGYGKQISNLWAEHLATAFQHGFSTFQYVHNKGERRIYLEVVIRRNTSDQGEDLVVTYSRDVSAEKEMAKEKERAIIAEARNEVKSQFLAHMSHEIRTPISAVYGISEVELRKQGLSPEVEEAFKRIHATSRTLVGIVNDILDISKIEAGKMSLDPQPYNVGEMLHDVTSMYSIFLEDKRFRFVVSVDKNLHQELQGDELRIKQVLGNILSNSFKYTEEGQVSLTINFATVDNRPSFIFEIEDTGYGMTPEQITTLLSEDYVRFSDGARPYIQGTGLGISITQNLIALMEGKLNIESELGVGTKVTVTIPQQITTAKKLGLEIARKLERFDPLGVKTIHEQIRFPDGRVLVIDDLEANLYVANGLLSFYGLDITTTSSPQHAISMIENGQTYDIIFMDQMMPEMSGTTATQILRNMGYNKPIVALTADAGVGQEAKFLKDGFSDFIPKPIQTAVLHKVLTKYL